MVHEGEILTNWLKDVKRISVRELVRVSDLPEEEHSAMSRRVDRMKTKRKLSAKEIVHLSRLGIDFPSINNDHSQNHSGEGHNIKNSTFGADSAELEILRIKVDSLESQVEALKGSIEAKDELIISLKTQLASVKKEAIEGIKWDRPPEKIEDVQKIRSRKAEK